MNMDIVMIPLTQVFIDQILIFLDLKNQNFPIKKTNFDQFSNFCTLKVDMDMDIIMILLTLVLNSHKSLYNKYYQCNSFVFYS